MYRDMNWKYHFFAIWLGLASSLAPAYAESNLPPTIDEVVSIDILPGWRTPSGQHMAAIHIQLADGWKTYWRAPGDTGIPPSLNWQGSTNLAGVTFHWPVPEVLDTAGMQTIGYSSDLILPMTLTPSEMGEDMLLDGSVYLGVCKDVCMPTEVQISITLPPQDLGSKRQIKRALRARPDTADEAGLRRAICTVEPISDGMRVTAQLDMPRVGRGEVVVVETTDPSVWIKTVSTKRSGGTLTTVADLVPSPGKPFVLNRSDLRLTVLAEGRGVDIRGCTGS